MTVKELVEKLGEYPDDFKVVVDCSSDYKDYCEAGKAVGCQYSHFRCGTVKFDGKPNAVFIS